VKRAVAIAVLLSVSASAGVAEYDVSARTSLATRSPLPGDVGEGVTTDLVVEPVAVGVLRFTRQRVSLQYSPRLIVREPQVSPRALPLHDGTFSWELRLERTTVQFRQDGSYGVADVGALVMPAGARPGSVFEVQTLGAVPWVRSASMLMFDSRPSERARFSLGASYLVSGDPTGGDALPLQWGPMLQGSASFSATRTLHLVTDAFGVHADLATGARQSIGFVTQSVRWQVTRPTLVQLGAGVAYALNVLVDLPGGPPPGLTEGVLPVAQAAVTSAMEVRGLPLRLDLGARMAPFADRFTGAVYERLEARAAVTSRPLRELTAGVSAGLGWALPIGDSRQADDRAIFADATARWDATRWFSVLGTARFVWTEQPRLGVPAQALWVVSLGALVRDTDNASF
jgi:hypothetical protein